MTHAELRVLYPTRAVEPSDCPGAVDSRTPAVHDPVDGHAVREYRCRLCGHAIVVDETAGRVRNDYREPEPFGGWGFLDGP